MAVQGPALVGHSDGQPPGPSRLCRQGGRALYTSRLPAQADGHVCCKKVVHPSTSSGMGTIGEGINLMPQRKTPHPELAEGRTAEVQLWAMALARWTL